MSKRQSLTTRKRVALFLERGGVCSICNHKIVRKAWDVEHRIPLALGGTNDMSNLDVAHVDCHKTKTRKDVRDIAKGIRVMAQNIGAKKSRNPMPGSRNHPSGLRKRMSGKVERW